MKCLPYLPLLDWTREDAAPEAPVVDPRVSVGSGYSESKWVAEHILERAAKHGLSPVIIRPGQLSGGIDGAWNINEWFPTLVRFSHVSGCVPNISGVSCRCLFWIAIPTDFELSAHLLGPN